MLNKQNVTVYGVSENLISFEIAFNKTLSKFKYIIFLIE